MCQIGHYKESRKHFDMNENQSISNCVDTNKGGFKLNF
jgi:hypothetical protein